MRTLATRLRRLDGSTPWRDDAGDDETFRVDIVAAPPCYWIDDDAARAEAYLRWAPPGPFVVDLGD